MAIAVVASVSAGSAAGNDVTTAAINTTGANLLIIGVSYYSITPIDGVSDSKGNTWTPLTGRTGGNSKTDMFYSVPSSVGTGHTFTADANPSLSYPTICVLALSGAHATPFDVENGAGSASASSLATGSVTPAENDEIVVTQVCTETVNPSSIDGGFTIAENVSYAGGGHFGGALAYLIQTTAAAANPTWTLSGTGAVAASIGTWKAAAAAAGWGPLLGQRRNRLVAA